MQRSPEGLVATAVTVPLVPGITRRIEQLDREQEALVYRVAQEAVRNAIAHAGAASLRVEVTAAGGVARLLVEDDGRGFDAALRERRVAEGHLGLSLMEELARQSGGTLEITSSERGTRIQLEVPSR